MKALTKKKTKAELDTIFIFQGNFQNECIYIGYSFKIRISYYKENSLLVLQKLGIRIKLKYLIRWYAA